MSVIGLNQDSHNGVEPQAQIPRRRHQHPAAEPSSDDDQQPKCSDDDQQPKCSDDDQQPKMPRRAPSRTSSVVLVDALRQRTSPRCLARTPAPCEQARPSSSVLCDRADNSGSYVPAGSVGTSHSPWRPEWAVEGRVAADAAIACAMLQASGLRIPMSLAHSQQSTVDLGK